jgi:hypothetical protein
MNKDFDSSDWLCEECAQGNWACTCSFPGEFVTDPIFDNLHPIVLDACRPEIFDPARDFLDDAAPEGKAPVSSLIREEYVVTQKSGGSSKDHTIYVWTLPLGYHSMGVGVETDEGAAIRDVLQEVTKSPAYVPLKGRIPNGGWRVVLITSDHRIYRTDTTSVFQVTKMQSKSAAMAWLAQ